MTNDANTSNKGLRLLETLHAVFCQYVILIKDGVFIAATHEAWPPSFHFSLLPIVRYSKRAIIIPFIFGTN